MDEHIEARVDEKPRHTWLWLSIILLLGFSLRVAGLTWGQAHFHGSASDALEAYEIAVKYACGEPRAQYIGQPNYNSQAKLPGPLWALFCFEGLRLGGGSVDGIAWVILGLNTLTLYLAYLLAVWTVGHRAALWSALLMAVSPEVVQYSVTVYNPVVMPVMGTVVFLALWKVTRQNRSPAIFWVSFLVMIMPQFHMSVLMLLPALLVILLFARPRINIWWLAAGLFIGAACYVPYVRGEMAHHWENTRGMFAGGKKGFNFEAFKVFTAPFSFLTNVWYPSWALTAEERREILESCFGTYGLSLAAMILSLIFAAVAAAGGFLKVREALRGIRKSMRDVWLRSTGIFFLTILFLVPLAAALAAGKLFHGRYCLVLLAPLFALTGAGITKWLSMPRARRIVGPIILLTIGCNIWFVPAFYRAQGEMIRNGPTFIPSFRKLESVYQSLKAHSGQERPIVVEVRSYSASLLPQEKPFHQAVSIRRYVAAREMWLHAAGSSSIRPAKYVLCFAADVESNDPAVGYRSNGIALVEDTSLP